MIEKRLKIAKRLLNPTNSVLIVTIDEREYIHLGCLLEEMFPSARMQMISSVINPAGAGRQTEFSRTDEYIYILQFGEQTILPESREVENVPIIWDTLRRSSLANARGRHGKGACGPNQFYPIYVDDATGRIREIGEPIMEGVDRFSVPEIPGCSTVFPVRPDGTEMNWGIKPEEARIRLQKGYLRAGRHTPNAPQQYVISYVTGGNISDIEAGIAIFDGYEDDGSVKAYYPKGRDKMPTTNWNRIPHDAQRFGTNILTSIIGSRFDYPKSLYAVYDCLRYFVYNKPNALIVDFFAGSGTTLHSVNLINSEDNGNRRCIMITNNEVSSLEAAQLEQEGLHPGDDRWEQYGVAKYVTWPRTKCSILGIDINGNALPGEYGVEIEKYIPDTSSRGKYIKAKQQVYPQLKNASLSDGFKANAAFFHLGFLDKTSVAVGRQFRELLPLLWLKAGAHNSCPVLPDDGDLPDLLVLPGNRFAVLLSETSFADFAAQVKAHPEIDTLYIVTDSEPAFRMMTDTLPGRTAYQLYRDYLENFQINLRR